MKLVKTKSGNYAMVRGRDVLIIDSAKDWTKPSEQVLEVAIKEVLWEEKITRETTLAEVPNHISKVYAAGHWGLGMIVVNIGDLFYRSSSDRSEWMHEDSGKYATLGMGKIPVQFTE